MTPHFGLRVDALLLLLQCCRLLELMTLILSPSFFHLGSPFPCCFACFGTLGPLE